jgi:predicted  nucleic acid-binding Zn-ribbon protein
MSRWLVEKRLSQAAERLRALRNELKVVEEQLAFLADAADDARLRALVSETPLAEREHHEAQKHAEAMTRHRDELMASIRELEKSQDELLDRLVEETG